MKCRKPEILSVTFIFIINLKYSFGDKNENLHNIQWWEVSQYFMSILNNGLFARAFKEKINEDFEWSTPEVDMIKVLDERQERVDELFKETIQGVKKLRDAIVDNFKDFKLTKPEHHCCHREKVLEIDMGCFYGKGQEKSLSANPPEKVIKQMKDFNAVYNVESMYYFSFYDGGMYEYPTNVGKISHKRCLEYDPHSRPWYELASTPVARDIVLLVDFETIADKSLALKTATGIIETVGQDDRIAVIKNNHVIKTINNARHVEFGVWLVGTARNKDKLKSLLEDAVFYKNPNNSTPSGGNRNGPSETGSETSGRAPINIQRKAEMVFVHVTSGSENLCSENPRWEKNHSFEPTVIITYIIGNLTTSSCQNISKRQHRVTIKNTFDLQNQRNKFSNFFKWSTYLNNSRFNLDPDNDIRITLPYKSYFDRGMLISLTLPIVVEGRFVGVTAIDIRNWISFDHISGYEVSPDSYGFLIDQKGRTLFHPLLPSPSYCFKETCTDSPTFDLISNLEQNNQVQSILQSMVNMERSIKIIDGDYIQSTGHSIRYESNPVTVVKRKLVYAWIPLSTIKLSLCTVIPVHNDKVYSVKFKCKKENCNLNFQYHLEDQNSNNCSYFGADVLKNEGLVKFSPWAFQNPIGYLNQMNASDDPIVKIIQKGNKYEELFSLLKGSNVKSSLLLTETAKLVWKSQEALKCFIGIRYIGTVDGVFLSYPGITLNATYDHRTRPWYQVAMANRKPYASISMTVPYIDYFSGGEVISLATSVDKKFPGWTTSAAVIGGDFSVEFLSYHLRERLPECDGENIECFLIDNMGYIILHLNERKFNKLHLTEIYPYIARELIQAEALMRDGCHDYEKDAVFLYWFFEMPFDEPTVFFGKGHARFVIHEIPFTNVYLLAKLMNKAEKIQPISLKTCNSTCSQSPEPPCSVGSSTGCTNIDNNLRTRFSEMPSCFPSDYSPNEKAKKVCSNLQDSNTCFKVNGNKNCKLWKPKCI